MKTLIILKEVTMRPKDPSFIIDWKFNPAPSNTMLNCNNLELQLFPYFKTKEDEGKEIEIKRPNKILH